jgi:hypothetical protein
MRTLRPAPRPGGIRPPLLEPVTTLPGLPVIPGEVRYPVPALASARLRRGRP